MTSYDQWLFNQAEQATAPCEPKVVSVHIEPQDGEFIREPVYSCENCNECDCEYWEEYNGYPDPEQQAEMDEAILWGI